MCTTPWKLLMGAQFVTVPNHCHCNCTPSFQMGEWQRNCFQKLCSTVNLDAAYNLWAIASHIETRVTAFQTSKICISQLSASIWHPTSRNLPKTPFGDLVAELRAIASLYCLRWTVVIVEWGVCEKFLPPSSSDWTDRINLWQSRTGPLSDQCQFIHGDSGFGDPKCFSRLVRISDRFWKNVCTKLQSTLSERQRLLACSEVMKQVLVQIISGLSADDEAATSTYGLF